MDSVNRNGWAFCVYWEDYEIKFKGLSVSNKGNKVKVLSNIYETTDSWLQGPHSINFYMWVWIHAGRIKTNCDNLCFEDCGQERVQENEQVQDQDQGQEQGQEVDQEQVGEHEKEKTKDKSKDKNLNKG